MPRLFSALEIPADVGAELAHLRQPLPGAKWVEPADYHLTLRFAGDVAPPVAREFAAELSRIEVDAFQITLDGLGAFGGNEPRALWAGVAPSAELDALARASERAARNAGLPAETRKFKPHVTLARLKYTPVDRVARVLSRHGGYRSPPVFVTSFALFSAKPLVGGGPYVVEDRFSLLGGFEPDGDDEL